jgi:hypothetical protein
MDIIDSDAHDAIEVENPAFKTSADPANMAPDDIELALTQGTLTEREAIVALQRQLREEMKANVAAMRDDMTGMGLHASVETILAQLTEAPTNW